MKQVVWEISVDSATLITKCPKCNNDIEIDQRWTPGGLNDYGGYILQCLKCNHIFSLHIGRDIIDSCVISGAKQIDQYNDEHSNKEEILKKYGISD